MRTNEKITLYHAPNSRSGATMLLLEELGAAYDLKILNLNKGEQRQPAYLALNPMGKVPAITHGGALITEQVAIYVYLPDLFPQTGLAPPINDLARGPYLRWLAFYGSCFEPAMIDRAMRREPGLPRAMPYSDFETMLGTLIRQLEVAPFFWARASRPPICCGVRHWPVCWVGSSSPNCRSSRIMSRVTMHGLLSRASKRKMPRSQHRRRIRR